MPRKLVSDADFLLGEDDESEILDRLTVGTVMRLLEIGRGWAWGYGPDGRVGYVRAGAFGA